MSFSVNQILEKMSSSDKDFRFMATHDLAHELEKEAFRLDGAVEPKIVQQLLKLLDDTANNVQENSVKCLGLLIRRVKEQSANEIVDTLCGYMLNDKKDELREISNIGLKTVIQQVSPDLPVVPTLLIKRLTPRLIQGVTTSEKPEVKVCCLDILNDLLQKFGNSMTNDLEKIMNAVLPQLTTGRPATRKRAISCLGFLAVSINDGLFSDLMKVILGQIEETKKVDNIRTLVQALAAVSRSVGHRIGKYLSKIVPLIVNYCENPKFDQDDELREYCIQCFESLILRCSKDSTPYLPQIINLCLKFIKHDPNYAAEDEEMETDEGNNEEEQVEDDGGDISDDDDMSWKVRRAATKTLSAIITTRHDLLVEFYQGPMAIAPTLISRFSEREENVKLDVFATFVDLLRQTALANKRLTVGTGASSSTGSTRPAELLRDLTPKLVPSITKQLNHKSIKTRVGAFSLLKDLVTVLPGVLSNHIAALVPGFIFSLGEKNTNSNVKIEALTFLRLLMATHPEAAFHPHAQKFSVAIFGAVSDHYYRISAEGLRVCNEFIRVIRPTPSSSFDFQVYVAPLYQACRTQFQAQDIDQEVKEAAITCMGTLVSILGDALSQADLQSFLGLLLDRLKNEITRITAVRALSKIATSPLKVDILSNINNYVTELSGFLRKSNRQLRQSSLNALDDIIKNYGASLKGLYPLILTEVSQLVNDGDLHLAHLALKLCVTSLQVNLAETPSIIVDRILPQVLILLRSSLLQGLALESVLALYGEMIGKSVSDESLLESLVSIVSKRKQSEPALSKQSLGSIAQCIAVVCSKARSAQRDVTRFIKVLETPGDETLKLLALLSLGEIGRRNDLSGFKPLRGVVVASMESQSEELKQAASFALGNITVGSMQEYLPFVLYEIGAHPKQQYLLLHSMREIIVRQSLTEGGVRVLQPYLEQILPMLFQHCKSEEEGTRNVVAECLGKLSLVCPQDLLPQLLERVRSPSAFARATVVTALKFVILDHPHSIDSVLIGQIGDFLDLLQDPDLTVRRSALLTLNYAAHNKPSLIRDVLGKYLPILYQETKIRPELIREVDLGPFKHKVDDGQELRKAAFDCMYTLLETSIDRLDLAQFVAHLVDGLKDNYDIKMLCHLMLIRLAHYTPNALIEGLPSLVEPLRQTVTTKVQDFAVKQQVERNEEMIRSALRAVVAIEKIPNAEVSPKWDEFVKGTIKTAPLLEKYQAVFAEDNAQAQQDLMDTTS